MATANSLEQAAQQAFKNLLALQFSGTLGDQLELFVDDLLPLFPDQAPGGRPIADWLVLIDALQAEIVGAPQMEAVRRSSLYIYKLCYLTNELLTNNAISGTQATAVLAAYNARF